MPSEPTLATIFSGGEGVGIGARTAGLRHLYGIEIDERIADVARHNGFHTVTADVCQFDPSILPCPDILHASPPCPNFSQANQGAEETEADIAMARATARFIEILQPRWFTLENLWQYRNSESWSIIRRSLYATGYWMDVANVNAADYGVPQSRRRMIVRAALGEMVPYLPAPEPWIGWYEAIEDLIPTLPETELAPWQLARLEETPLQTVLYSQGISRDGDGNEYGLLTRDADEPASTVTANSNMGRMRAYLVGGQFGRPADGSGDVRPPQVVGADDPAFTVTASNKGDWRVILIDSQNARSNGTITTRLNDEPAMTVTAASGTKARPRIVLRGRVVSATVRCLARWQTFPDSYELPEQKTLASNAIGNAVPPLLYRKIVAGLIQRA